MIREIPDDSQEELTIPSIVYVNLQTINGRIPIVINTLMSAVFFLLALCTILILFAMQSNPQLVSLHNFMLFSCVLFYITQKTMNNPSRASAFQQQRNSRLFTMIHNQVHSNFWAREILLIGARNGVDTYGKDPELVLKEMKDTLKTKQRWARQDCQQGHHDLCFHNLPTPVAKWLTS